MRDITRRDDPDSLGSRDINRGYDWSPYIRKYVVENDYWKQLKAQYLVEMRSDVLSTPDELNTQQRLLYDTVTNHYISFLNGFQPSQLLINLDGKAGTGKSFLIMLLSKDLQNMAPTTTGGDQLNPVKRAAPTGVAAYGISGQTLHSMFKLPVVLASQYQPLSPGHLLSLQSDFRHTTYLIIDEKSMIGIPALFWIDQRCREIFMCDSDKPFSGLNIILAGDFYQLPPIMSKALFDTRELPTIEMIAGRQAYHSFDKTIELTTIVRQQGDATFMFRQALEHLRLHTVTKDDWLLLSTRAQSVLTDEEIRLFDTAIRIYATHDAVDEYNLRRLRELRSPVIRLDAISIGQGAKTASSDDAGNLLEILSISIGARIMLTENLWTAFRLVNGAFGTITEIVWPARTTDPRSTQPLALMVHFDSYTRPAFFTDTDRRKIVPILPSRREFTLNSIACSRTQFSVVLAYAITVHKAQGITVLRAVLNIKKHDFCPGLAYVAVSRVRSIEGIMFDESFDFEQFSVRHHLSLEMRLADALRRRAQHIIGSVHTPPVTHAWSTSEGVQRSPGALIRSLQQQRSQRLQDDMDTDSD
ncbi:hypothetical protein N7495_006659 [Penicillium taxi]|uniref:uncharacterized protein n=1 Tax=Penicillium taxi TaxID=168475 RepID=UPI002545315D|nr:uncharacterized protein N7495_006659 [Penicillium taxi]KAJ5894968.1 hypothetical protein N7495_006659 [Penicillium taxi]